MAKITEQEIIEREEISMGRPIEPLNFHELDGGASVLTYIHRSTPEPKLGTLVALRYAVHIPEGGGSSGIIETRWEKNDDQS